MTSVGVTTPWEGDRFSERAAAGLRGEGFGKRKMEDAGIGRHEIKETPREQRRVHSERKRQREKRKQPKREERDQR